MSDTILKVENLRKIFPVKASAFSNKKLMLKAVDGVSFELKKGETLGLVGESGCGKTTVGRTILRLYEADGGRVYLDPQDMDTVGIGVLDKKYLVLQDELVELLRTRPKGYKSRERALKREIRKIKGQADEKARDKDFLVMDKDTLKKSRQRVQMVFQDPWASLNPRMLVKDIISEGVREFGLMKGENVDRLVADLLQKVGLPKAAADRYPHEFSGGQRQRICIARALAVNPEVIVCDEPVSALDVSIQAQVLNLLIELQEEFGLTFIFIAHDLSVVQYISDRVAVMYLGKMVEMAESVKLYDSPRHPYTRSLLDSVPVADPDLDNELIPLEGDVPSPVNPPSGCYFHPRCKYKTDICMKEAPELKEHEPGRLYACHNPLK